MQNLIEAYNQMNNFGREHGMHFSILSPGHIEYHFIPGEQHLATTQAVHGGMIAAFMDAVIGVAALSAVHEEGKLVATVEFKINFTAPAFSGIPLKGIGKVLTKGKSTLVVEGNILDNQGKLVAAALGTLKSYLATQP